MAQNTLKIIGIQEQISLPKAYIENLPCKIDTGAYNSSIDCSFIELLNEDDGTKVLRYTLLSQGHPLYTAKVRRTKKFKCKTVRSSNGTETNRYQVKLKITFKGETYKTTFNLSNRSSMRFPVLIGRRFLADRFLVDVSMKRDLTKDSLES